jgi:GTPase
MWQTIGERYQAMIHCGNIRQSARIVAMVSGATPEPTSEQDKLKNSQTESVIRTGDRAVVRFRFMQSPEYIKPDTRLLFREGRTKGVGKITRVLHDALVTK